MRCSSAGPAGPGHWEKKCMPDTLSDTFLAGIARKCDKKGQNRDRPRISSEKCAGNARAEATEAQFGRQIGGCP